MFIFQIDCAALLLMDEENVSKYLPKYGDQVAALSYSRQQQAGASRKASAETRKSEILQRLRSYCGGGMRKGKRLNEEKASKSLIGNKNALKTTRRIEVGWLNYDKCTRTYKQVKVRGGGGTRHIKVEKDAKANDIIAIATDLFFPKGISKVGTTQDYSFELRDFSENLIDTNSTISEMYEKSKLRMLRLYLCTKCAISDDSSDGSDIPDSPVLDRKKKQDTNTVTQENDNPSNGSQDIRQVDGHREKHDINAPSTATQENNSEEENMSIVDDKPTLHHEHSCVTVEVQPPCTEPMPIPSTSTISDHTDRPYRDIT